MEVSGHGIGPARRLGRRAARRSAGAARRPAAAVCAAAVAAAAITTTLAAPAAAAVVTTAATGVPAAATTTIFTPGEGTGAAWCPGYGGTNLGSFRDVYACAPKNKRAGKTPFDSDAGFQCTELANRFLYKTDGRTLFDNEEGGNFVALAAATYSIGIGAPGSAGSLPAAGDIISMWGGRSKQKQNGSRTAAAIVTKVARITSGWTITTLSQGEGGATAAALGFGSITVSANGRTWSALGGYYASFNWLRLAKRPGGSGSGTRSAIWSASEAPLEAPPGGTGDLVAVACTGVSTCTAVGVSGSQAMLVYSADGSWKAAAVPVPASATSQSQLTAITCRTGTSCLAAGQYHSAGSQQGMLLAGHGTTWTATRAPLPPKASAHPHIILSSVACATATSCVAVGRYTATSGSPQALIVTGHASSWSGQTAPLPADASSHPRAELSSVACPAAGRCTAVGRYTDQAGNKQGLVVTETGSAWTATRAALPPSAVIPGASLSAVSCPATARCEAVGTFSASQKGMVLTGSGSSWTAAATPLPPAAAAKPSASFLQIVCPSATACVAAGSYLASGGSHQGVLLSGHGASWKAVIAPLPSGAAKRQGTPGAALVSVACGSATSCVAAGHYTDSAGDARVLLLTFRGSAWTAAKGPLPANDRTVGSQAQGDLGPPAVASVTCPAAATCIAVGTYPARTAGMEGLLEAGTF